MSQEWYLLSGPNNQLSGFEEEAINDFGEEGFLELLQTEIAYDVEILNYDLSEKIETRAIIESNLSDTKLKTMQRVMLVPIGTCKAGMYVKYKDKYWLIVGLVDNNKIYEKAVIVLCNYLLSWVDDDGINQRWVNCTSASQYNNGETGMKFYMVRSDQLMVLTPNDDKCLLLNSGQRFIIDKRCSVYEKKFDNGIEKDTSNPVTVYKITRSDTVLFDYQDQGHSEFMAYQDEQHETDGYYVVGGKGYWLCSPPNIEKTQEKLTCSIEKESDEIYVDLDSGIFTSHFFDADGFEIDVSPVWEIESDFDSSLLHVEYIGNTMMISITDDSLINKSFILKLSSSDENYESTQTTIYIRAFI